VEIEYENRIGDVISFNTRALLTRKSNLGITIFVALFVTTLSFSEQQVTLGTFIVAPIFAFLVFIVLTAVSWVLSVFIIVVSHTSNKDRGVICKHKLSFTPEGYIEETPVNRNEGKWSGVYNIVKGSKHIYFYESPMRAHLIPRRVFPDRHAFNNFHAEMVRLWREADLAHERS